MVLVLGPVGPDLGPDLRPDLDLTWDLDLDLSLTMRELIAEPELDNNWIDSTSFPLLI